MRIERVKEPEQYFGNKKRHIVESVSQFFNDDITGRGSIGQGFLHSKGRR
jgi:hypothetical protein